MSKHLQSGHHPDADQISAFVDRALSAHERDEMLAHLAECADCRETVALSLPAIETTPAVIAVKKSKPRWGMWILWPAAAAALTVLLFYIPHATNSHKAVGPGQEVAGVQPPAPAKSENALAAGGGAGSHSLADRQPQAPGNTGPSDKITGSLGQRTAAGSLVAKTEQGAGNLHLPGGAIAISVVTRGRKVLAIDARNTVLLSNDGGASWIAVRAPWEGRALRAELVSYPVPNALNQQAAAGLLPHTGANVAAEPKGANAPDAAQFAAQKSLRQELKGSYQTPINGSGATLTTPSQVSPPALTAPMPGGPVAPQGTLTGVVTDRTGAVIPDASIAIRSSADLASKTAMTGADGRYRIDGLAPGTYQFEAQARGFKATTLSAIQIVASSPNTTNVTLDVGASAEAVMVQAAPEIETTSPELGSSVISEKQKSAPRVIPGRSVTVFVITTDSGDHWTSADGINWHRQ